jgi:hypothetical protein
MFGVFIHDDEHAANEHLWKQMSDNNNSSTTSNNDVTNNIKERRPSWGGPGSRKRGSVVEERRMMRLEPGRKRPKGCLDRKVNAEDWNVTLKTGCK